MRIEHVAWMVHEPAAVAAWYIEHLAFSTWRSSSTSPYAHFLYDESGQVMIEIYNNPVEQVPDYPSMHPLLLHLAFVSTDPAADRDRLVAAGATILTDLETTPVGDRLVMLRDPWGFPIQLCQRGR